VLTQADHLTAGPKSRRGHTRTVEALLRVPEPWRPLLLVATAADEAFYRPQRRVRFGKKRAPSRSSAQLEFRFPPQVPDPDRPLFDLFPEAYASSRG
jgi:hypothetical protein